MVLTSKDQCTLFGTHVRQEGVKGVGVAGNYICSRQILPCRSAVFDERRMLGVRRVRRVLCGRKQNQDSAE